MPLMNSPSFKSTSDKFFMIEKPAIAGLNLKDLEYVQNPNQSPYMINIMYRNGAFSKRYGQEVYKSFDNTVYNMIIYRGHFIVHVGTKIYKDDIELAKYIPEKKGLFVLFNQNLYYFNDDIYQYDDKEWKKVEPYVPTIVINRRPNGTSGDTSEAYNMIGRGFQNNFHGDGSSTVFVLTDKKLDSDIPKVKIDNVEWTYDANLSKDKTFKVDFEAGKITLKSAAPSGTNNVEIIAYKHDEEWDSYHEQIMNSKYYSCFGGNNNSRLFVAGGGKSTYYYSDVYDASYFPYTNYARVGNSADDITGFGQQYNVLMIFKPTEIYSLTYYQQTTSTTTDSSVIGTGAFISQVVNSSIGCDCPNTIQLINNQLTWYSSVNGICTLVSTNIIDERNVRLISRNIDRSNNLGMIGILDINLKNKDKSLFDSVMSLDYDSKYFLVFPKHYEDGQERDFGYCYMWDYALSPFAVSSSKTTNPKDLAFYLFDNFYVDKFIIVDGECLYASSHDKFKNKLIKLNNTFEDLDFNQDGKSDPIKSAYMTPLLQFQAVEYLKTIKKIYIQCRGDTSSKINMKYITNDNAKGEYENEPIVIGSNIWKKFKWNTFAWTQISHAKVFMRKCALKKVEMAGIYFENNQLDCDMSISYLGFQYQIIKNVK